MRSIVRVARRIFVLGAGWKFADKHLRFLVSFAILIAACVGPISLIGANVAGATTPTSPPSVAGADDAPGMSTNSIGVFAVDPESGDFWRTYSDISVNGYGPGLDLARTYNSTDASVNGLFGLGWTAFSGFNTSTNTITMPDGSTIPLTLSGSTYSFPAYAAADDTFVKNGSGTYTFVFQGTMTYNYNSSGALTSMVDTNGATTSFTYNGSSQLTTITDAAGRTITLTYNADDTVATATDPLRRVTTYSYTEYGTTGTYDLTSVSDPLSRVTSFAYYSSASPDPNAMETITLPNDQSGGPDAGDVVTNVYNSNDQVTSQTDRMAKVTSYSYSGTNGSSGGGSTTVTDPDGNETLYDYTSGTLTSKTTGYGTASAATWTYTEGTTLGTTQTTDPNGNVTSNTYDADGNLLTSTNGLGATSSYSYNAFNEQTCATEPLAASQCSSLTPPAAITVGGTITPPATAPPAYATYREYDTDGNLIYTTTGDYTPGGSLTQSRTTYNLYNGESVTLSGTTDTCTASAPSSELPCARISADSVVTQLTYDTYGDLTSKSTLFESVPSIAGTMFTFAGGAPGPLPATTVFQSPVQLASATVGSVNYVYVADGHSNVIRSINAATDEESVVAGNYASGDFGNGTPAANAQVANPNGIAVDSSGDMAIADTSSNMVRYVPAASGTYFGQSMTAGDIYTIAGNGASGLSGNGALATSAELNAPDAVAFDGAGIVVADTGNNEVRFIPATTGTYFGQSMTADDIYAIAGTGTAGLSGNGGAATSAKLNAPNGVAVDANGDVAIADHANNEVRFIPATTGTYFGQSMTADDIYAIAGTGTAGYTGNGSTATSAELNSDSGVTFDSSGDVVIADTNNHVVRFVPKSSATYYGQSMTADDIYAIAGNGTSGASGNGGAATSAELGTPVGVAVDSAGDVYIADLGNDEVRVLAGATGTLVGLSVTADDIYLAGGTGAGTEQAYSGAADNAELNEPSSVRIDAAGDVFIADTGDNAIRIVPQNSGTFFGQSMTAANIYTIAGNGISGDTGNAGLATAAELSSPHGVAVSSTGNIAIADTANNVVRFVPATSGTYFGQSMTADDIYTVAGNGTSGYSGSGGLATSAELNSPDGVSFDAAGDLVIADTNNHVVRFVPKSSSTYYGQSMTADDIYVIAGDHTSGYSGNGGIATSAELSEPNDVTLDAAGDLLIPDTENDVVRFVPVASGTNYAQSMTADDIYTIAGNGTSGYTGNGGPATSAEFNNVMDAAFDSSGDVFIADTGNDYLRFIPRTSGEYYGALMTGDDVYNIAGEGTSNGDFGGDHDPPLDTEFGWLSSVAYDGVAGFYLADSVDQRIRHDSFNMAYYTATTGYTYDADGEMTSETSPNGNVPVTNWGNHTTVYTYNADGEVTIAEQGGGTGATVVPRYIYYGYDADGNESSMKDPMGNTYTYSYNADDEQTLSTNPLGNAMLTCYDGDGNVAQTVPPVGVAANSLTTASCPTSYPTDYGVGYRLATDATTTTYSALNEATYVYTPAPPGLSGYETTTKVYDLGGRLTSVTAPPTSTSGGAPNNVTEYTYNAANELVTTTTGYGTATAATKSSCYDPDGDITATVPGDGNASGVATCSGTSPYETSSAYQTGYSYDSLGELVTQTAPATSAAPSGEVTTYAYDPVGNQITVVSPDGVTTTKTYTPLNLLATVNYSGGTPGVTYTYDANGNEIGMTDASGTTTGGFDPYNEQTSTTNGAGLTTTHAFNLDGDVDRVTYPLGSGATWASTDTVIDQFNSANQLYRVTDFNSKLTRIGYSADGLPTSLQFGSSSGPTVTTTYAANDEPASITLSNGTTLQEFAYSDEPSGAIASETDTPSGSLTPADYVYDAQSRVTKDTPGSGTAKSYIEDASSNVTTLPTGASGTYNDASELTSSVLSGTTTNYTYDASGNRTGESGGSTVSATYNGASELTSYDNAAANMSSATYNGNGLLTAATTRPSGGSASTQDFVWNTVSSVPGLLQDSTNAYIYGPSGTPFEQVNLSTGTIQFLVTDALGSVRGVVSSSGTLTATTSYDAWGNSETTGGLTAYTPFGFAGGYTNATGLIYFLNRYYDPTAGIFFTVDPDVMTTGQPYAYAEDDAVNVADPSGEIAVAGPPPPSETVLPVGPAEPISTAPPSSSPVSTGPLPSTTPGGGSGTTSSTPGPLLFGGSSGPQIEIYAKTATFYGTGVVIKVTASLTVTGPNALSDVTLSASGSVTVSVTGGKPTTIIPIQTSVSGGINDLTFAASQTTTYGGDQISTSVSLNVKTTPTDPFSFGDILTGGLALVSGVGEACVANPLECTIILSGA